MKTLRQLCAAVVLTLMLAFSVFAGEISTVVAPPAPPTSSAVTGEGEITTMGSITEATLSLLGSVLALF